MPFNRTNFTIWSSLMILSFIKIITIDCVYDYNTNGYNSNKKSGDDDGTSSNIGVDASYFCKFGCKCVCNINERNCRVYCRDPDLIIDKANLYDRTSFNPVIRELTINNQNWTELVRPIGKNDLQMLDLSANAIERIRSGVFKNQLNLKKLVLAHNKLTHLDEDAFRSTKPGDQPYKIEAMTFLDLTNNRLDSLNATLLTDMVNLKVLNISRNPIFIMGKGTIMALQASLNLEVLNISDTLLQFLPGKFLNPFRRLYVLDMSNNQVPGVPTSFVNSTLRTVYFNNNTITTLEVYNGFRWFTNISELHMSGMEHLEEIGRHAFAQMPLRILYLSNNPKLAHIHPHAFQNHDDDNASFITELHLENNALRTMQITDMLWDKMDFFNLTGNPWSCDCNLSFLVEYVLPLTAKFRDSRMNLLYTDENMRCASPPQYKGTSLYHIVRENDYLSCDDQPTASDTRWSGAAIFGFWFGIIVLLVAGGVIVYFYVIRNWPRQTPHHRIDAGREMVVAYIGQPPEEDEANEEDNVAFISQPL